MLELFHQVLNSLWQQRTMFSLQSYLIICTWLTVTGKSMRIGNTDIENLNKICLVPWAIDPKYLYEQELCPLSVTQKQVVLSDTQVLYKQPFYH